ncbi:sigma-70 family RNA polymerase sigma factor [Myxococcus sp. MISCRS1]|jgi:RNA polymerase sigma-70 factor (ECF subfamily)|uniref:RNA polymerase sigma factor n=1 Tax=Myxococcus TaxID=32 RepID=UPI001142BBFA|nr:MULTISPECIES: sigma-70 family RNA polymerase sigma factor [Myxococcus]BDT33151.1 sigma-70 family RNA polymerase sigma factor [Myxococcus sp. MH1]MBZ4400834.1 sigma-70 family RNA polymerase sigma factor [Myxococcus sp. AS-1-15]MBZ4413688.1 sigma-70 family RNA polymerase sigma factor [Myxococcus sp. XM-1-1-1]MCK8501072.1 sigma-70 family RNA polymerase sigma factor [Myxococcus fulvus]MCP3061413.1 sigma-70 family RNA polymerase sigma factor [Myxococcus guangdongensis]
MSEDRLHTLYRTYGPSLYARCRQILGDDAAAADAAQETFLRLHRQLDRAPDAQHALAWIYRVATNYCLNQARDRRRRAVPVEELPDVPGVDSERLLEDRDLARRLITTAPPKVAEVAWLHLADGMTQEEVAQLLGISRRTVVNRLADFHRHAHALAGRPPS